MTEHPQTSIAARAQGLSWKWPSGLLVLWLAGALLLMQPFALAPGRTLYLSDALLVSASGVTGSGLSPVNVGTHFSASGLWLLVLLIQTGFIGTLWVAGAIGTRLFEKLTTPATPVDPGLARLGLWAVLVGQLALFIFWMFWFKSHGGLETRTIIAACFSGITGVGSTGLWLADTSQVRQSGLGQAVVLPLMLIAAIGLIPLGDLVRYVATFGRHTLHPVSRWVLTCAGVTFVAAVGLLLVSLLMPHAYAFFHLGMESSASRTEGVSGQVLSDALSTSTFYAGPGRVGMIDTQAVITQPPAFGLVMIGFTLVGFAPLSMAGGISALALGVLVYTWLLPWRLGGQKIKCDCDTIDMPRLTGWANSTLGYFLCAICLSVFLLSLSEPYPLVTLLAEATSAASNAGFSLGVTGELTSFGKGVLIALMLLGRVVPLWLADRYSRLG